jgi:hypothetical protein
VSSCLGTSIPNTALNNIDWWFLVTDNPIKNIVHIQLQGIGRCNRQVSIIQLYGKAIIPVMVLINFSDSTDKFFSLI